MEKGDTCALTSSMALFPSLALSLAFSLAFASTLALATGRVRGDLASLLQLTQVMVGGCQVATAGKVFLSNLTSSPLLKAIEQLTLTSRSFDQHIWTSFSSTLTNN